MKRILTLAFFTVVSLNLSAQKLKLNEALPIDKTIKKGVLDNGITYYLHNTDVKKNVASYYIIQNVGSVLEEDNQQGLAHFLEHMAFNGTKNFKGKALLNSLQEKGLVFGRDINAYTNFDETVYNINNVPTTPEMIKTGLTALKDWSNYLLLTDEEIDAERGVIKEEWRTRQNGQMRIFQKTLKTAFGGSKYGERIPIGITTDVIENFKYKALRDFYNNWYRTDLQAIAIVGDIDVDMFEAKIKKMFSSIPAVKNPQERFVIKIDDNEKLMYDIATDKEISTSNIAFSIRHNKSLKDKTVKDLKEGILNTMINQILRARFQEVSQQTDAPFIAVRAQFGNLSRAHNEFTTTVFPKPNKQKEAFKLMMSELVRAAKFGFTKAEIKRTISQFSSFYENRIAKINDRSHGQIVQGIQKNYLENAHLTDIVKEYELVKTLFNQLTQVELLQRMREIYTKKNRSIIVTGVEGKDNLSKKQAEEIINAAENDTTLQKYKEEGEAKSLMSGVTLIPGKIVKETSNEALGFTTFYLSNEIKVHYKFADKQKNSVKLEAISEGGKSLLSNDELPSAEIIGGVVQFSGLGEFSMTEIAKVLAGKTANTTFGIGETTENVRGSSSTKDVETMLQLVNLRFTKPRFDKDGYNVLKQNIDNFLVRRSKNLQEKMKDSITTILYGKNHSIKRVFNKDFVEDMSFEKAKSLYKSRFSNAADFEFFIVGDVKKETLKSLLAKYIASIPTTKDKEIWKNKNVEWVSNHVDKDVFISMENPKATVRVAYKKEIPFTLKNQALVSVLGKILQLRYTESLREEEGGTYGASSNGYMVKEPKSLAYLSVSFDCNPDKVEKLVKIVHQEFENIVKGNIKQTDLDKVKVSMLKDREESKNFNSYEMLTMKNFVLEGYNMNKPKNFVNIVNSITKESVKNMAVHFTKDYKSFEIVFKPAK